MGNSNKTQDKKSYYILLNRFLKKNQDKNYNNSIDSNNTNYSFSIKQFSNRFFIEPNLVSDNENISWITYFRRKLLYLYNKYNYIWAKNLNSFLVKNTFLNQYKYNAILFFEEYEILSLPKLSNFSPVIHYYDKNQDLNIFQEEENIIDKNSLDSESEYELKETDNISTNINRKKGYKEIINEIHNKNNISIPNNVLGSLASISLEEINSFLIENDPTINYKLSKAKIKQYIEILIKHLSHKDHPINIIINKFIQEFNPIVLKVISNCKNILNKNESLSKCEDILYQLQEFMIILQVIIKLFYSQYISYDNFRDEKDEIVNLVSFLIFNSGNIYKNIYEIIEIINLEKIQCFEKQIEKFGEMNPEEMGVKEKFCLNEITKQYMNKYKNIKTNFINNVPDNKHLLSNNIINENNSINNIEEKKNNEDILKNQDNHIYQKKENFNTSNNTLDIKNFTMPKSINNFLLVKMNDCHNEKNKNKEKSDFKVNTINTNLIIDNEEENFKLNKLNTTFEKVARNNKFLLNFGRSYSSKNIINENGIDIPYYETIKTLKSIIKCKTPLEKMIIISSLSSFITDNIYKFWKPMEELIHPSFLNIETDELVKILLYVVYNSKMTKLFVHLDFIKYFTIKETKSTMIGYYYTLIEGALISILEAKNKEEFKNK